MSPPSDEVARLAASGRKIAAIKQYRQDTGVGLAQAKAVVDAIAVERPVPSETPSDEVVRLAASGAKIEAIKQYRLESGAGLADARAVVEGLAAGQSSAASPGPRKASTAASRHAALFLGATLLGLFGAVLTGRGLLRTLDAGDWLATEGTIVTSGRLSGSARNRDRVRVEYDYTVGGTVHRATRISFTQVWGYGFTDAVLERYRQGAVVTVYYHPEDPDNAVLERDVPLFYSAVFTVSLAAFAWGVRRWRLAAANKR